MFVKIDRAISKQPVAFDGHTTIYECDRFLLRPVEQSPGQPEQVFVALESEHCDSVSFIFVKSEVDVFVMNSNGKTIDSYRWASFSG